MKGDIKVGSYSIKDINPHLWRQNTGAVMQEGFLFSDSIANNIALSDENVDHKKLLKAVETAISKILLNRFLLNIIVKSAWKEVVSAKGKSSVY